MNVLRRLTLANLRQNRKRSIVTIIGIMLSTALIVAVAGMAASGRESLVRFAKQDSGDYHLTYFDVTAEDLDYLENHAEISRIFVTKLLGYAEMPESVNPDKRYYYVCAMTPEGMNSIGLHLLDGRLPETDRELLVSRHIISNAGHMVKVGDIITLDVGVRKNAEGQVLTQFNGYDAEQGERIEDTEPMTYTVVGLMDRPNSIWEPYYAPGYTVITRSGPADLADREGSYAASVNFRNLKNWREVDKSIQARIGEDRLISENIQLIRFGGGVSTDVMQMLVGLASALLLIIIGTSVFVIRNSFQISVSEKRRLYGMLSSIGATSRQMKSSVLFEGFLLGLVGIPLGLLCGHIAILALLQILNVLLSDLFNGMEFVYGMPPFVRLLAVFLAALTIYLSCLIPAARAGKTAPIDAIRGQGEITVPKKRYSTNPLIRRLFGMGGEMAAKNLKRSRKKYRTTVVSLVISISVFIALSGFVKQMKTAAGAVYFDYQYNLTVSGCQDSERYEHLAKELGLAPGSYSYAFNLTGDFQADPYATEQYRSFADEDGFLYLNIGVLQKDAFAAYCRKLGVTEDPAKAAILCSSGYLPHVDGKTLAEVRFYTLKEGDIFPVYFLIRKEAAPENWREEENYRMSRGWYNEEEGELAGLERREDIRITRVTGEKPMGFQAYSEQGQLFLSEEYFESLEEFRSPFLGAMRIMAEDPYEVEEALTKIFRTESGYGSCYIYNQARGADEERRLLFAIEIFLYGFLLVITLIGVTNIFNTITTNMILRSREFATLKSVGMTTKEFNRMIRLESVMYGCKSLLFGVPLGLLGSLVLYRIMAEEIDTGYRLPYLALLLSVLFVFLIVGMTMRYSLGRINKQNIIETIRNENI